MNKDQAPEAEPESAFERAWARSRDIRDAARASKAAEQFANRQPPPSDEERSAFERAWAGGSRVADELAIRRNPLSD